MSIVRLVPVLLCCAVLACSEGKVGGVVPDSTIDTDGVPQRDLGGVLDAVPPDRTADLGPPCELTCPGCCLGGQCLPGSTNKACGQAGVTCQDCTLNGQTCQSYVCVGTCTPYCAGKCQGQDDGCGGSCPTNSCTGCCDAKNVCLSGNTASACGTGGASCVNCTLLSLGCSAGTCTCVPSCNGKCAGAEDGCGGICSTNHCTGCCDGDKVCRDGKIDTACGKNGAACEDCTASSQTCQGGGSCS